MNRIEILVTIMLLLIVYSTRGQIQKEFELHLNSISSTFFPGHILDREDTVFNANSAFIDYTIQNLLVQPSDKYFIANRNLLPKFKNSSCNKSRTTLKGKLKSGENCKVAILTKAFQPSEHQIVKEEEEGESVRIKSIDGKTPYGGEYELPVNEINQIEILINGKPIPIPKEAYSDLYEPNSCKNYGYKKRIEGYTSIDGKYIYIYIFGGEAASTYFSKLIFNKDGYVTRIIADYYSLSIHSSFRESFIGY